MKRTHGEADARKQAGAVEPGPADAFRQARESQLHAGIDGAEDPELLADEQAGGNAEGDAVGQRTGTHAGEGHAGIGKAEQRYDQEGDPGMQRMFKLPQR